VTSATLPDAPLKPNLLAFDLSIANRRCACHPVRKR
jgi:hypothetical protein